MSDQGEITRKSTIERAEAEGQHAAQPKLPSNDGRVLVASVVARLDEHKVLTGKLEEAEKEIRVLQEARADLEAKRKTLAQVSETLSIVSSAKVRVGS